MPGLELKGAPVIEGDYSAWTLQWLQNWGSPVAVILEQILTYEDTDILIVWNPYNATVRFVKLSDGTLLSTVSTTTGGWDIDRSSSLTRYFVIGITEAGIPVLKVYKRGSLIQTVDLKNTCGWASWLAAAQATFSSDGKYILVQNGADMALFKGI